MLCKVIGVINSWVQLTVWIIYCLFYSKMQQSDKKNMETIKATVNTMHCVCEKVLIYG